MTTKTTRTTTDRRPSSVGLGQPIPERQPDTGASGRRSPSPALEVMKVGDEWADAMNDFHDAAETALEAGVTKEEMIEEIRENIGQS